MEKMKTYKCECCQDVFVSGRSEQVALEESNRIFPALKEEDRVVVCNDCFKKIMKFHNLSTGEI